MVLSEYNGFTPEERMKGDKIIKKAIADGILPDLHTIPCELCGQTKGIREYHAEDYSPDKILDDVICVCKKCHRHIHAKNKETPYYKQYEKDIRNGKIYEPEYNKRYWTKDDDLPI